jgi:hypothetical protein
MTSLSKKDDTVDEEKFCFGDEVSLKVKVRQNPEMVKQE